MYVMFSVIVDLWTDNIYSLSVPEIKDYCNVASHESSAVAVVPKQLAATGINHGCRLSVCYSYKIK